jgi:TamB, inner membrane protein subunit of TAM complex
MENGTHHKSEEEKEETFLEKVEEQLHLPEMQDSRTGRKVPRWLKRVINVLAMVLLLPFALFQIPWVQSKAARELTAYLSKEWHTTVSIDKVWLGIFNEIKLEGLYLEDQAGDSLIVARNIDVDHSGLFNILRRKWTIESLTLEDATVNIRKKAGEDDTNLRFILDYFSKDQTKVDPQEDKPSRFQLNLQHVYLRNVRFVNPDEVKGTTIDVALAGAEAHIRRFDLLNNRVDLSALRIKQPDVKIRLYPVQMPPEAGNPTPAELVSGDAVVPDSGKMRVTIRDFDLTGGIFSLHNLRKEPERTTPAEVLNYSYLDVNNFEVHVNDFAFSDLEFEGEIEKIALRSNSGFVLDELSAKEARLTCKGLQLNGMKLMTPYTELGDTLALKYGTYRAFKDFVNEVKLDGHFHGASVALQDIMVFAPALENNVFFRENKEEVFQIEGQIKGPVNRLDGRNLHIDLADGLRIAGNFSTRNLAVPDEQYLHLNLDELVTDVRTLRKLIPGFNPPENFNRLGRLNFSGKFDGFFVDFVADGNLRSDIGTANMFMNLKLREGREKAQYFGDLYLKNFDLGIWSGNPEFGKVTFASHVKEGVGLTLNSANAKLEATIDSLRFRDYMYKNAAFNGQLKRNLFDGYLNMQDQNIDLTFQGTVNFADSLPAFNFVADIKRLALRQLNFTQRDFQFKGHVGVNARGNRLSNVMGDAEMHDFQVVKNKNDTLSIDRASVVSMINKDGDKQFLVDSNLGEVDITGQFDIEKIPTLFLRFLSSNYPGFAGRLGIKPVEVRPDTAKFSYEVSFFELQNLFGFFDEKIEGFDESKITGSYDSFKNQLFAEIEIPAWSYENISFNDVYFRTKLRGDEGNIQIGVVKTSFNEKQTLSPVSLIGTIYQDTLEFLVISSNFFKILDNINLNGVLSLEGDKDWRVSFKPSALVLLNQTWEINTSNYLRIGQGSIETRNFVLSNADERIVLKNVRDEGLELQLQNYPLDSLDLIRNITKVDFGGVGGLHLKVKDIFHFQGLSALLRIDDLTVNDDNYGVLRLDASAASVKNSVNGYFSIENDSMQFLASGYFNPPGLEDSTNSSWQRNDPNYFDFTVSFTNYPTHILKYFVADVSNVVGSASAKDLRFYGPVSMPELEGEVSISGAAFTLNSLRTTYSVPEAVVKVGNKLFDATGNFAYDRFGNRAYIEGGITHDHLKDFGLDLRISTEPGKGFLGLETTANDNPVFYGTAIGTGHARFSGSFKQPTLDVHGRSLKGTKITIPISNSAPSKEVGFITFKSKVEEEEEEGQSSSAKLVRGLNMEFDLELTPAAQMEMIFDKAWGDVIKGTGSGNIKVNITRDGRFDMAGEYTVESGDYLFTLMNLGFNKPFSVEPGGTITWSGDPYNAVIDINAVYKGLNTSVYNFIQEYLSLASTDVESLARTSTPVDLKMNLKGNLLKPAIDFDIGFPALSSELRNIAENKMRTIRQDPNELNRQVFGLLVLGQFLPSDYTLQAGEVGINTISEMLSSQLSIYLTEFVSEIFTGSNIIQGIDLDISYNRYNGSTIDNSSFSTGNELQGRMKVMVSDKVSILVGGNFDVGGGSQVYTTNSSLLASEFMIEYVLTKDRRLKIKAYSSTEPDIAGGRSSKFGAGLSFRKEFDNIADLLNLKKK